VSCKWNEKKPKHYILNTTEVCNSSAENIVSQDFEENANNGNEIDLNELHEMSQSATMASNPLKPLPLEESLKSIGNIQQKARVIKKAYTKPTARQILLRPSTQECSNNFGYLTVGDKLALFSKN
jgi:hypothetical protein